MGRGKSGSVGRGGSGRLEGWEWQVGGVCVADWEGWE